MLLQATDQDLNTFKESDVKVLSSHQLIEFLSLLLQEVKALSPPRFGPPMVQVTKALSVPSGPSSSDSCEEDAGGLRPQCFYERRDPL